MIVVIDTNVALTIFKRGHATRPLFDAWAAKKFVWAVSTEVLLEYEEIMTRLASVSYAALALKTMQVVGDANRTLLRVEPNYRFQLINDPDDNKFTDCAIVAKADWVITKDHHFDILIGSGYQPQPITPDEFIRRFLSGRP